MIFDCKVTASMSVVSNLTVDKIFVKVVECQEYKQSCRGQKTAEGSDGLSAGILINLTWQAGELLILVEWTSGCHVVNLVLDCVKNLGIFLGPFGGDSVDNISVLGHSREDSVDELDDVNHVLLHESA